MVGTRTGSQGESGSESIKWNAVALIGRQTALLAVALVLAVILGPEAYGIVAQANVYITLTGLILDQGISAALISRSATSTRQLGAAMSLNILLSAALAAATFLLANPLALFFNTPELAAVLVVLGLGLLFKGATVVPRVILTRRMQFRSIAISEPAGAFIGGLAGLISALLGAGYWSLVIQMLVTDFVVLLFMYYYSRPPFPNLAVRELRELWKFSTTIFVGQLVSYASRNVDNILVGRIFGPSQLAFYALSYRILLVPIQMIGQVVTRVLFPAIVKVRHDKAAVCRLIARSEAGISFLVFPVMLVLSAASFDFIAVFLGAAWSPAAPVLAVLCITGARQAVTSLNSPILMGMDKASAHLRFNVLAAFVQISGIVIGIPFGILGVAVGYTIAGVLLTPVIGYMQKRIVGMTYRAQLLPLLAPLHSSLWAVLAYILFSSLGFSHAINLFGGGLIGVVIYVVVLRQVHRSAWDGIFMDARAILGRRPPGVS